MHRNGSDNRRAVLRRAINKKAEADETAEQVKPSRWQGVVAAIVNDAS